MGRDDIVPVRTSKVGCLLHYVLYEVGNEVLCIMWMQVYRLAVTYRLVQTELLPLKTLSTSTKKTDYLCVQK